MCVTCTWTRCNRRVSPSRERNLRPDLVRRIGVLPRRHGQLVRCGADLAAVAEAHVAERRQLGLQAGLLLELLPHAAGLLDGLQHRLLLPEQRRGVQAGQEVCKRHRPVSLDLSRCKQLSSSSNADSINPLSKQSQTRLKWKTTHLSAGRAASWPPRGNAAEGSAPSLHRRSKKKGRKHT